MIMSADQKTPNMNHTSKTRNKLSADDNFLFAPMIIPHVLLWFGFATHGWDGVWVFDVQSWTVFPSIAHDYKLIMRHYGDDTAHRYFQYTLHGIVYAYLVAVILVPIRIGLSTKYPFSDLPQKQTKYRLFRGLLILNLIPFMTFFVFSLLKAPGEYSAAQYIPMSPKHIIISSMFVSAASGFFFLVLIIAFRIFIKGEKLYED